tara:strand:+ start:317 stop:901 length:585 start_codon:yes stop_codon:yes gene_type:complete
MSDVDIYKKDMKQLYLRKKNTFRYSVNSADGEPTDSSGDFSFQIPPLAFTNKDSQYCLFRLTSAYVVQDSIANAGKRASGTLNFDIPCLYVDVQGMGIAPNNTSTNLNGRIRGNNMFFIPNSGALCGLSGVLGNGEYQCISGGIYQGAEVVCSNPSAQKVRFRIYDGQLDNTIIPDDADIQTILNFEIELLDID